MLDLRDAMARGALARVTVLREERRTRDALRVLDELDSPRGKLGVVPKIVERYSTQAGMRERAETERIHLLIRQQRPEAIEQARSIAAGVLAREGPKATEPYLDGDTRMRFLSTFAVVLSQMGDESGAIRLSEYFLAELGLNGHPSEISARVQADPKLLVHRPRIALQLSNLTQRRIKLAYLAALDGDRDGALEILARARVEAQQSLELRSEEADPRGDDRRLISRSSIVRVQLETAVLLGDPEERSTALERTRIELKKVVTASYELPTISPMTRIHRACGLAMVVLEQALMAESRGEDQEAKALAWAARVALKPSIDLWVTDADESLATSVRFGDACRLTGAKARARAVFERSRDRLLLYRGQGSPAVGGLAERIAMVSD